jgi:hypothetical protein
MTHDEEDSDSSGEAEEGLQYLLGGLVSSDFTHDAWDNQSLPDSVNDSLSEPNIFHKHRQKEEVNTQKVFHHGISVSESFSCDEAFLNSYRSSPYGNLRPPVRIVDLSSEGRGNILVATERIKRGQVIFTERAAVASQLFGATIRACQFCFRSLEPIHSCCVSKTEQLPSHHLWPISNFDFSSGEAEGNIEIDRFGRRRCKLCQSHFCSPSCHNSYQSQIGDCCNLTDIQLEIPKYIQLPRSNEEEEEMNEDVEPALMLATRLFVICLQHYRATSKLWMEDSVLTMCGNAEDLTVLELGQPVVNSTGEKVIYNLQRLYDALVERFEVSAIEQTTLSSELSRRLASIAARNGFGIRTQSPFRPYYAALLRSIGGRDNSAKHLEVQNQVARALGAPSLQRGMDRQVDAQVAPEIVALFLLISRINHSCCPNAEVLSQEFVDNHVDLVAKETIEAEEEITISYIGTGPQSATGRLGRHKRQLELYAKYLFHCGCIKCSNEAA